MIDEQRAAAIFALAIRDKRAAELLNALFAGAGVMMVADERGKAQLVIISAEEIERVSKESFGE